MPLNDAIGEDADLYLDAKDRCVKRYGWSEAAWRVASAYVKSQLIHDAAEVALRQRGYDPELFAADYRQLSVEERRMLAPHAIAEETRLATRLMLRVMRKRGVKLPDGDALNGYFFGLFMGLAAVEFLPEEFLAV